MGVLMRVTLTAHPFQRIGAFALPHLLRPRDVHAPYLPHPEEMTPQQLRQANQAMTSDLSRSCAAEKVGDIGSFWLRASYMLWPNCPINTVTRSKLSAAERREKLRAWRDIPDPDWQLDRPCTLCSQPACGVYGKIDIPLMQAASYLNTTPSGGTSLCRGCLLSFYALPYGCSLATGRPHLLHSWDDNLLAHIVADRVAATRTADYTPPQDLDKPQGWARYSAALAYIRQHTGPLSEGFDQIVFINGNQEPVFEEEHVSPDLAQWVNTRPPEQIDTLLELFTTPKTPGAQNLGHALFTGPSRIRTKIRSHMSETLLSPHDVPGDLYTIYLSYMKEIEHMPSAALDQVGRLADNIARSLSTYEKTKAFLYAQKRLDTFKNWLRREARDRLLMTDQKEPFITEELWEMLFDSDTDGFLYRDMLLIGVLARLHASDPEWRKKEITPADKADREALITNNDEDEDDAS